MCKLRMSPPSEAVFFILATISLAYASGVGMQVAKHDIVNDGDGLVCSPGVVHILVRVGLGSGGKTEANTPGLGTGTACGEMHS